MLKLTCQEQTLTDLFLRKLQSICPRDIAASCVTAFFADGCGGRSRGGSPRGRPETFHRSRGAKLQEESSQPAAVLASRKHRRRASVSEREPTSSAAKSHCNIAKSTVNFGKLEIQLVVVDPSTAKVDRRIFAKIARHIPTTHLPGRPACGLSAVQKCCVP